MWETKEALSAIKSNIKKWSQTLLDRAPYKICFPPRNWGYRIAINTVEEGCSLDKFGGKESEFAFQQVKPQMFLTFVYIGGFLLS